MHWQTENMWAYHKPKNTPLLQIILEKMENIYKKPSKSRFKKPI